jgi:hypothetical protein
MQVSRALLAALTLTATSCRVFDPGLPTTWDSGTPVRVPRPPVRADAAADLARSDDLAADRTPGEPLPPGPPEVVGCADGTREAFASVKAWARIAGCAGAWDVPGLLGEGARSPRCGRAAGNDGANTQGIGCNVSDLCAAGWHVCVDADEVRHASLSGCESAILDGQPRFFLVMSGASPQGVCSPDRSAQNDLHGCGTFGQPEAVACDPLDRRMTFAECEASGVWSCGGAETHLEEAALVTKRGPELGGALCCLDD